MQVNNHGGIAYGINKQLQRSLYIYIYVHLRSERGREVAAQEAARLGDADVRPEQQLLRVRSLKDEQQRFLKGVPTQGGILK